MGPNSANDLRSRGQNSSGGGRGIPDYKDGNPVRRSGSSARQEQQDGRFDSAEANKWMQSRYNAISEEIDKYKREQHAANRSGKYLTSLYLVIQGLRLRGLVRNRFFPARMISWNKCNKACKTCDHEGMMRQRRLV